jgi:hypothetical protein
VGDTNPESDKINRIRVAIVLILDHRKNTERECNLHNGGETGGSSNTLRMGRN